jgi:hypothetical protein
MPRQMADLRGHGLKLADERRNAQASLIVLLEAGGAGVRPVGRLLSGRRGSRPVADRLPDLHTKHLSSL